MASRCHEPITDTAGVAGAVRDVDAPVPFVPLSSLDPQATANTMTANQMVADMHFKAGIVPVSAMPHPVWNVKPHTAIVVARGEKTVSLQGYPPVFDIQRDPFQQLWPL